MMILKQRKMGTFFGMMKIIIGQCTPYINWVQLALVSVMSFYTTLNPMFADWGYQFPFWAFLIILVGIVLSIMAFEWFIMMPSYFGAANVQSWEHENPQRDLLERMSKDIQELKAMVEELKRCK